MEASFPISRGYLDRMTVAEWEDLYKRVRLFTYTNYGWLPSKIRGLDLEGVILEAIEDTYFGRRRWPVLDIQGRDKGVSLCVFICQTVRSKVSHIVEKEKNKFSLDEAFKGEQSEAIEQLLIAPPSDNADHEARYHELSEKLLESVQSDTLLTEIVLLYINTPDLQPGDLAEKLGLPMAEIRNALRRLSRKARDLQEGWRNG